MSWRSGFKPWWGKIISLLQTRSERLWNPPSLLYVGYLVYSWGWSVRDMASSNHPLLALSLKMGRAIPVPLFCFNIAALRCALKILLQENFEPNFELCLYISLFLGTLYNFRVTNDKAYIFLYLSFTCYPHSTFLPVIHDTSMCWSLRHCSYTENNFCSNNNPHEATCSLLNEMSLTKAELKSVK